MQWREWQHRQAVLHFLAHHSTRPPHAVLSRVRGAIFAHFIKAMIDGRHPNAGKIRLVMDNLNTHNFASLHETFAPAETRRLVEKLEIYYTPKHGSWLNI
jgi:hypothetical protein